MQAKDEIAMQVAERRANVEKSMRLYQRAMEKDKESDYERKMELLTEAVASDDRNVYAHMALGIAWHENGDVFRAASAFYRASRLAPNRYEPHYNLGIVLESAGQYGKAIDAYETALELAPGQVEVMENLARCQIRSNVQTERTGEFVNHVLQSEVRPEWRMWLTQQMHSSKCKKE